MIHRKTPERGESIQRVLRSLGQGEPVLLVDDASTSPSCHLVASAALINPERVCFFASHARGILFAPLSPAREAELKLPPMCRPATADLDLTVSVEARHHVTTGISAADRAETLRTLALTQDPRLELVTPGHIFPVRTEHGGVLVKSGVPECAVDLMTLAGLPGCAVSTHCLTPDGSRLRVEQSEAFAAAHQLSIVKLTEVIRTRLAESPVVRKVAEASMPTAHAGAFRAVCFSSDIDGAEHLALIKGDLHPMTSATPAVPVLCRIQVENRLSDLLGYPFSTGLVQIRNALAALSNHGSGIFVYIRHARRGGVARQVQELSTETPYENPAQTWREYGVGSQILRILGVQSIRLLTNSTRQYAGVTAFGIDIVDRVSF